MARHVGDGDDLTISERLASHFAGLTLEDVPSRLLHDVKVLMLDYLGVAIRGSRTSSAGIASRFVAETGGTEEATLIGSGPTQARVPADGAAFANAIASHSVELDDVDVLALFHFSPPVLSAAFAAGERVHASGADVLLASVAGCEMMTRVSAALNPSLRNRGFHSTPVCGVFGAATASGLLEHLSSAQLVSAIGLAGAQSGGLMEMYGPSMQKRFNPGPAARDGVVATRMAALGFTGAATIFEGERGVLHAFSDDAHPEKLTEALGTDFPVLIEYKPYSCARPIHNAIDCALAVRPEIGASTREIAAISVGRHPDWAHYHLNARPSTYHEAQVSLPHSVAVALIEGVAMPEQYDADRIDDPEVQRLSRLVEVHADAALRRGVSCTIDVALRSGRHLRAGVDHPRGAIENPMTTEDMRRKLMLLAGPVVGSAGVEALASAVDRVDEVSDIRTLLDLTRESAG